MSALLVLARVSCDVAPQARHFRATSCEFFEHGVLLLTLDPAVGHPEGREDMQIQSNAVAFRNYRSYFAAAVADLAGSSWDGRLLVLRHPSGSDAVLLESEEWQAAAARAPPEITWIQNIQDGR